MGSSLSDTLESGLNIVTGGLIGGPLGTGIAAGKEAADAIVPDIPDMPKISTPGTEDVTAPATIDDSGARAAEEERRQRAAARGRASTVLTSPSGLSGQANIGTATLLG